MKPNNMNDTPINIMPIITKFLLPTTGIILPTKGLKIITATEYAKMTKPTHRSSTYFL